MRNEHDYKETLICDVFLSVAIGTGLAWWVQQWWFA